MRFQNCLDSCEQGINSHRIFKMHAVPVEVRIFSGGRGGGKVRVMFIWVYCNSKHISISSYVFYCYLKMGTQSCQVRILVKCET